MPIPRSADPPSVETCRATRADLGTLAPLFDAYRVFYGQASDPDGARAFLAARCEYHESVIFLARDDGGGALGFIQLYPMFSSVSMRRIWQLNDLYVLPAARRRGVARALMMAARDLASASGALRLVLETAEANHAAQALYEALGYRREAGTRHYSLALEG